MKDDFKIDNNAKIIAAFQTRFQIIGNWNEI